MLKPVTILSVPGHDSRKLERCRSSGADLLFIDLEDAVPADQKTLARERMGAVAQPGDIVRINGAGSPHFEADCSAVLETGAAVAVPKISRLSELGEVMDRLPGTRLWPIIESPRAVVKVLPHLFDYFDQVDEPDQVLDGLIFGHADYMLEAGLYDRMGRAVEQAMCQVVSFARALGLPCYDSPCESLTPIDLQLETRRAFHLGFTGKGCYHPDQLPFVRGTWERCCWEVLRDVKSEDLSAWTGGCLRTDAGRILAPPSVGRYRRLQQELAG